MVVVDLLDKGEQARSGVAGADGHASLTPSIRIRYKFTVPNTYDELYKSVGWCLPRSEAMICSLLPRYGKPAASRGPGRRDEGTARWLRRRSAWAAVGACLAGQLLERVSVWVVLHPVVDPAQPRFPDLGDPCQRVEEHAPVGAKRPPRIPRQGIVAFDTVRQPACHGEQERFAREGQLLPHISGQGDDLRGTGGFPSLSRLRVLRHQQDAARRFPGRKAR